jgi:hypothetical protein
MQVARKPNRRPYGLVLVCLLVFCLTVPRYWQARNAAKLRDAARLADTPALSWQGLDEDPSAYDFATFAGPSQTPPEPTTGLDEDLFAELISPLPRVPVSAAQPEPLWSGARAATQWVASFVQIGGRQLAQCSPDELVALMARFAELRRRADVDVANDRSTANVPTLRLTNPNDRLAMVPLVTHRLPTFSELVDRPLPPPAAYRTAAWPWAAPTGLFDQLRLLAECPQTADWAQETIAELKSLTDSDRPDHRQAIAMLERLDQLADEAIRLAGSAQDDRLRVELLRAHWGLARRIDCWSKMYEIDSTAPNQQRIASRGSLEGLLDGVPDAGAKSVDLRSLSAGLEGYEQTDEASLGRSVRAQQLQLLASDDATERGLGEALETHYRNANIRIAVTGELLNRYLSQERVTDEWVRDCIVGTPVRGRSETSAQSRVHLIPTAGVLNLELETNGVVNSNTLADGGQAIVHTLSTTDFWVKEPIVVDREGIRSQPKTADAENCAKLVGVKTMFDWVPLLGAYVRARAVEEYRAKRPQAKAEVECKVTARASRRVGSEADEAIDRVDQEIRERFTRRLSEYGVEVTPIELTTTSERLIARLRMASDGQLGAHSPRPRAPADSLASLQIHQSALTNAAIVLDLNGKRFTAPELQQSLRTTFPRLAERQPDRDVRKDTVFDFADRDAIQFRVSEGRAELMITLKEFIYEGKTARNFIVHAFYRPEVDGLDAKLVRDGGLGIEGRLGAGDRARLHNVFETVLPTDRTIPVFRVDDPDDPRLAGLMITQLVLEDGWVGMAIGPTNDGRVAQRWRSLR